MKALMTLIVVAVLGGGGTFLIKQSNPKDDAAPAEEMVFAARRGEMKVTITENGTLMAKNSEKITPLLERGGTIKYLIEEGKTVEVDAVLCLIDTEAFEDEIEKLDLDILRTKADLGTAETELDIQVRDNVASIEKAKIAFEKAGLELDRYRDGDAPKDLRKLEVAIKEAETNFSRSKKKYEDSMLLLEKEYINKSQVEQDEIDFERAEIQLEGARRDLDLFNTYTKPMTLRERETSVTDAQRELENSKLRAGSKLRQREVAVESQSQRLDRLEEQVKELHEEIEKATIKAPVPGIVLYGDPQRWWSRGEIKLGAQIWGGVTLFTIPDLRVMQVQVQVHEADISKIEEGQTATITMDTYPGLVLTGTIERIATIAGQQGRRGRGVSDEVKKFTVNIVLDEEQLPDIRPGISAKAEIYVETIDDAVYVPIQCVFIEESNAFCYVVRDGEPVQRLVTPGTSNDLYVQISEGLSEGEDVLMYNPSLGATGLGDEPDGKPADDDGADEAGASMNGGGS